MRRKASIPDIGRAVASKHFNLSSWAIRHGGFTAFLMVLLLAAGAYSLVNMGQKEDPDFTFRVMVVQVQWQSRIVAKTPPFTMPSHA